MHETYMLLTYFKFTSKVIIRKLEKAKNVHIIFPEYGLILPSQKLQETIKLLPNHWPYQFATLHKAILIIQLRGMWGC